MPGCQTSSCPRRKLKLLLRLLRSKDTLDFWRVHSRTFLGTLKAPLDAQNNYQYERYCNCAYFCWFAQSYVQHYASPVRSPPCHYKLFLCCVSIHVLSSRDFALLGMVQHVVDYSYLLANCSINTTAILIARLAFQGRTKVSLVSRIPRYFMISLCSRIWLPIQFLLKNWMLIALVMFE